jgi:hypothetical protein
MKRILSIVVALVATIIVGAQNIAVVDPSDSTTVYQTLDKAIRGAKTGSIIYIPGGGFPVTDNTQIDKQLTIMGVSHRGDTDNVDGSTIISGNLNFVGGSSGSALIGVYVSGNVNIATSTDSVINFTMRHCNVNSVQVHNANSSGMIINQCYLRNTSNFGYCNVKITHSILLSLRQINGGNIEHNVITSGGGLDEGWRCMYYVNSSSIRYNFILGQTSDYIHIGSNCFTDHNCIKEGSWGDNAAVLPANTKLEDVFRAPNGVTITSDYHLTDTWAKSKEPDLTGIGIYGFSGTDFDDKSLAPIPRIVSKKVAESTDGSGKLLIEVTVKAK